MTASDEEEIKLGIEFVEKTIERSPAHVISVAHHIALSQPDPENRSKKLQDTQE